MKIEVATPCRASWADMSGSDRVRHCGQCKMNVYNLSGMDEVEVKDLVQRVEGRLCVRFYRRIDGTVLTKDCPIGTGQRLFHRVTLAVGALLALVSALLFRLDAEKRPEVVKSLVPPHKVETKKPVPHRVTMGEMVAPEKR